LKAKLFVPVILPLCVTLFLGMLSQVQIIGRFFSGGEACAQSIDTTWVRKYTGMGGSGTDWANSIVVDRSGNVYVSGSSQGSGSDFDYATIKYYPNGSTAWVKRYNGPGNGKDESRDMAVDTAGNVYVTGISWGGTTDYDLATIKYLPDGDTAWVRRYNGPGNGKEDMGDIAVDNSGNVYVTGSTVISGSNWDYVLIKYYPNGDTAWTRRYDGPGNLYDDPSDVVVDNNGYVYVTGASVGSGTYYDFTTIKYNSAGALLWVNRYNGSRNIADHGVALAVDGSGNVYASGATNAHDTSWNSLTIKYNSIGFRLWTRTYNGPANDTDETRCMVIDNSGNVYVAVMSKGIGTAFDYATIKYYSNGDTAWVRRYNGPGNSDDDPLAIALDSTGNVYVTGYSVGSGTYTDYATIKYYANGDTAWVRRFRGSLNWYDYGRAITVDSFNNVYVTGQTNNSGTGYDYSTIKYWQSYPPNAFSLLEPLNDTNFSSSLSFQWEDAIDGDPGDTVTYDLFVSRSNSFKPESTIVHSGVSVSHYSDSLSLGTYYWKVKAYDKKNLFTWSTETFRFSITLPETLWFYAYSPVNLIVTDPIGDSIGVDFKTIPNATYDDTTDLDHDGDSDDKVTIPNPIIGDYQVRVVRDTLHGGDSYTLGIRVDGSNETIVVTDAEAPGPGDVDTVVYEVTEYLHGDANRDGKKTVSDVVFLINYLFKGGQAPDPVNLGDVNFCQQNPPVEPGQPTVADVIYMVNYLFRGGPAPCS
jgi:hypothetical protein